MLNVFRSAIACIPSRIRQSAQRLLNRSVFRGTGCSVRAGGRAKSVRATIKGTHYEVSTVSSDSAKLR